MRRTWKHPGAAKGSLAKNVFVGTTFSANGLGSLGDDDGGSWTDIFTSNEDNGDDESSAKTGDVTSTPSFPTYDAPTGPTPSSMNCWPKSIGERPPGSTLPYCTTAQDTAIHASSGQGDGSPLGPIVAVGPTNPKDPSQCIMFNGQVDPACMARLTAVAKPVPGPGPKPIPTPTPVVEQASVWSNPLVWAGIALAGGIGLVAYKKHAKKKALRANWHY